MYPPKLSLEHTMFWCGKFDKQTRTSTFKSQNFAVQVIMSDVASWPKASINKKSPRWQSTMISHVCRRHFSGPSRSSTFDYCMNIVQKRAHEQYLATLLLPPNIKACGIILRAFNVEISSIRDQISAKPAGIGRMVFWHELVDNVYSAEGKITDRHHPIAIELQKVVRTVSHAYEHR